MWPHERAETQIMGSYTLLDHKPREIIPNSKSRVTNAQEHRALTTVSSMKLNPQDHRALESGLTTLHATRLGRNKVHKVRPD